MPSRWIRVVPADALRAGFREVRREADVPEGFAPDVVAEAGAAAAAAPAGEREPVDVPFVTIDPPGSRDLDQALHIERRGDGHRVRYAIADVSPFVAGGGALDRDTHARGVTVYAPDEKAPLPPPVLSEGAASLLPGEWRPAVVWTFDLDATGAQTDVAVRRAEVRSAAQHTYEDVPADVAALLAEVGERRLALERERGGVRLAVPEQEVIREDSSWNVRYRVPLATEDHNAQISLLTGMAAAQLMLEAGTGILRTQAAPSERSLARLRRQAVALGVDWPEALPYPDFVRGLDPADPAHAAVMHEAAGVGRHARYPLFRGAPPPPRRGPRAAGGARATPSSPAPPPPTPATSPSPPTTRTPPRRCGGCRTASCRSAALPRAPANPSPTGCAPRCPTCRRR